MFEALKLRWGDVNAREEELRACVSKLLDQDRRKFYNIYEPQIKDPDTYATLNYFFLAGLHHFYLGKFVRGVFNLSMILVSLLLSLAGFFFYAFLIFSLIVLIELPALFRSQVIVTDHNVRRMELILEKLQIME